MDIYLLHYISIIIVILYYLFTTCSKKLTKSPPTPLFQFPVIGHLHHFKTPIIETYAELANRYGSIVMLWKGWKRFLIVSSPSAVQDCLFKSDIIFCNCPQGLHVGNYIGLGYKSLNFAPYGPHWKNLRRISTSMILSSRRLEPFTSIRVGEVRLLINRLCDQVSDGIEGIELKSQLLEMSLNIMKMMVFGQKYDSSRAKQISEIFARQAQLSDEVGIADWIPFLRLFEWSKMARFKQQRNFLTMELLEEHRIELRRQQQQHDNNAVKPFIQQLLELQETEPTYYNDEILLGLMWDLIVGSRSIAGATEWTLSLLLNNPEVLEKVEVEMKNHVGYERLVEETDLKNLQYLNCVINESLRMYPLFPVLGYHESSQDCVVGGYHVPQGTELHVNVWALHNDPKSWEDPSIFKPERFQEKEARQSTAPTTTYGPKFIPFGYGRRICPGQGLAIRVMSFTIASLIQSFEWKRVNNELIDMTKMPGIVMHKTSPLCAKLKTRPFMHRSVTKKWANENKF